MKSRLFVGLLLVLVCTELASAGVSIATALVREADIVDGLPISAINNSSVNHVGGYAFTLTADDSVSKIFGNASGGVGSVLRSEATIGEFEQTSFETFFEIADAGQLSYSPSTTNTVTMIDGLDAIWVDDTPILTEEDPVVATNGSFSSFNSRPGITADGTPYWVGGVTDVQGGGSVDRGLFYDGNILIQGGDNVGVAETVTVGSGIDFDFRFSKLGTNVIAPIDVASSSADDLLITINGSVISPGGNDMREGTLMPVSVGGDGVENYDNFDFTGISETGDYLVTGDTDNMDTTKDEFILMNGQVILREGQVVSGFVLNGSIESAYMNEQGDYAAIWDVDDPASGNVEALIYNGDLLLKEGDLVDWDNDGVVDANRPIVQFTGLSAMTLSDRDGNGDISIFFTADIDVDGSTLEGGFCYSTSPDGCAVVPEPSSAILLIGLAGLLVAIRRRA